MKPWNPSARQARSEGLKRRYYAQGLRELVDYDYDDRLPEAARQWLAAFTEEHYRGWRLSAEEQVTRLEHLRAAGAAKARLARGGPALLRSMEEQGAAALQTLELQRTADAAGLQPEELRGRNFAEDSMIARIDAQRLVGGAVAAAAAAVGPAMMRPAERAAAARAARAATAAETVQEAEAQLAAVHGPAIHGPAVAAADVPAAAAPAADVPAVQRKRRTAPRRGGPMEPREKRTCGACGNRLKRRAWCRCPGATAARGAARAVESQLELAARIVREARALPPALLREVRRALAA